MAVRLREEELQRREEAMQQRDEEVIRREMTVRSYQEDLWRREGAIQQWEAEARRMEAERLQVQRAAIIRRLASTFQDPARYKRLLRCPPPRAQTLLDFFQTVSFLGPLFDCTIYAVV